MQLLRGQLDTEIGKTGQSEILCILYLSGPPTHLLLDIQIYVSWGTRLVYIEMIEERGMTMTMITVMHSSYLSRQPRPAVFFSHAFTFMQGEIKMFAYFDYFTLYTGLISVVVFHN